MKTHAGFLNTFFPLAWMAKDYEQRIYGTWIDGNWFSERTWRIWYENGKPVSKVEINPDTGEEIGSKIDLR